MKRPNIEIDCNFIREKIVSRDIKNQFVISNNQLANIFTYNDLELIIFISSLIHTTYMHQLENKCWM